MAVAYAWHSASVKSTSHAAASETRNTLLMSMDASERRRDAAQFCSRMTQLPVLAGLAS